MAEPFSCGSFRGLPRMHDDAIAQANPLIQVRAKLVNRQATAKMCLDYLHRFLDNDNDGLSNAS